MAKINENFEKSGVKKTMTVLKTLLKRNSTASKNSREICRLLFQ
ncbi:hypothetical protein BDW_03295 [Bdellovibrio bacteriovorus W]|nr:hypothetical protein BDW_03295 [Bdellovibrio bacteriovorus W]